MRVPGGLTVLQGPGRSGAPMSAPYHLLAIQALLVAPKYLGGYAGHHVGRDLLWALKVGDEVLNVWECIQACRLKYMRQVKHVISQKTHKGEFDPCKPSPLLQKL